MNISNKKYLCIAALLILSCLYFFSPHITVYNMKSAIKSKDADAINNHVDYPALKESLKANFNMKFMSEMSKQEDNPFAGLGMMLGMNMVNALVDSIVTPEGVSNLMRGQSAPGKAQTTFDENPADDKTKISMGYNSLDKFTVTVQSNNAGQEPLQLIYVRHGLMDWKLSAVKLPL